MRLRYIIFFLFIALGSAGFATLMLAVTWKVRPHVVAGMRETMEDLAEVFAKSLENRLVEMPDLIDDAEVAQRELDRIGLKDSKLRLFVMSPGVFRETGMVDQSKGEAFYELGKSSDADPYVAVSKNELLVVRPIMKNGIIAAYVGVGRPLSLARRTIWESRISTIGIGLGVGVITVFVGWWLSRRISHSLERLALYVNATREGKEPARPRSQAIEIEELSQAFDRMRRALEGKEQMENYAQSLAHALKAPLAGVRASSEILRDQPNEEDRKRFVDHVIDESERMDHIVERLLRLATLESGRLNLDTHQFDLGSLAKEKSKAFLWAKEQRGIQINTRVAEFEISGDSFWIGEAIMELISNAIEFSPDDSLIELDVAKSEGKAFVAVRDRGQGIPDWALERISERFYSIARESSGKKGTGLGLALVREVARLHSGEFSLANREGGGAEATLILS